MVTCHVIADVAASFAFYPRVTPPGLVSRGACRPLSSDVHTHDSIHSLMGVRDGPFLLILGNVKAGDHPPVEERKRPRKQPVTPRLLVKVGNGVPVSTVVVDESVDGGACLLFESEPDLSVGSMVTIWFRQAPTKAIVKSVVEQSGSYRVGVQWCGEGYQKAARPFGSIPR